MSNGKFHKPVDEFEQKWRVVSDNQVECKKIILWLMW